LKFKGNQLTQINTVFTVGYTVGQVPCNIALYYVKPRIFFPSCMVGTSKFKLMTPCH
jgi:ACS family pantothenate transporter-like MFS transporter